jgi:hypothetical protein
MAVVERVEREVVPEFGVPLREPSQPASSKPRACRENLRAHVRRRDGITWRRKVDESRSRHGFDAWREENERQVKVSGGWPATRRAPWVAVGKVVFWLFMDEEEWGVESDVISALPWSMRRMDGSVSEATDPSTHENLL